MRIVAHLISVLLLLPGLFVCAALLSLAYLSKQPSMLSMINAMLDLAIAFFPLTFLLFFGWIALALMGFSTRFRRAGAIVVAGVAAATTGFMLWRIGAAEYAHASGTWLPGTFVTPGALALAIGIWLASTEWPDPLGERRAAVAAKPLQGLE